MFKIGAIYNRRTDIHDQFGGNQQSGIVTTLDSPFIFLFSALRGEEYGYRDGWISDNEYGYSGEGKYGNQRFMRGNRAIRDHVSDGRELHLFERHEVGTYTYIGQFSFDSYSICPRR